MTKVKSNKKPWPTKKAMEQVYELNLWGGGKADFYSGEGSHKESIVEPYINVISDFLRSFETPLNVVDLGCGDFNIGNQLYELASQYKAVDIVGDLINLNKLEFKADNLEFDCLNLATDELPKGDCAIIRQVLQHLSNNEVLEVVKKLSAYKYVILTEHIPTGEFESNLDIISGQGIRLKWDSGLNLLQSPFNLQVKNSIELLSIDVESWKGRIVTTLFEL